MNESEGRDRSDFEALLDRLEKTASAVSQSIARLEENLSIVLRDAESAPVPDELSTAVERPRSRLEVILVRMCEQHEQQYCALQDLMERLIL